MELSETCCSQCTSIGREKPRYVPAGGGTTSGPREHPGSTPGWEPQGDGEGAPRPGQAVQWDGTGGRSLGSTDILCQTEEKHQPRLGGMQKLLHCCRAPGRHPKTLLCPLMPSPAVPGQPSGGTKGLPWAGTSPGSWSSCYREPRASPRVPKMARDPALTPGPHSQCSSSLLVLHPVLLTFNFPRSKLSRTAGRKVFPTADLGNICKSILGVFPRATHAKGKGWPHWGCCMATPVPAPPARSGAAGRMHKENTLGWSRGK